MIPLTPPSLLDNRWCLGKGSTQLLFDPFEQVIKQRVAHKDGWRVESRLTGADHEAFAKQLLICDGIPCPKADEPLVYEEPMGWQIQTLVEATRRFILLKDWKSAGEKLDQCWKFDWMLNPLGRVFDDAYARARLAGAYGGCHTWKGLLLIAPPEKHMDIFLEVAKCVS